MIYNF